MSVNLFNLNFNEFITLNKYGTVKTKTAHTKEELISSRRVLALVEDASSSEVYSARNVGLRPELTFVINLSQYNGEDEVLYKDTSYTVIRKFSSLYKGIPVKKLVCEVRINGR